MVARERPVRMALALINMSLVATLAACGGQDSSTTQASDAPLAVTTTAEASGDQGQAAASRCPAVRPAGQLDADNADMQRCSDTQL